ncbi:MAG: S-layer glycoprotein N-glycosyltransferase AglJ [Halobacteria archaeon]
MSIDPNEVCILIPTLNEEATIAEVVDGFTSQGFDDILVIDGGSTDDTQEIAEKHDAWVVEQEGSGKGQAVQQAFEIIEKPYVVMIDGDGTYLPEEVDRLLEPLAEGYDQVIGNRLGNDDAFDRLNYIGNKIFNYGFRKAHGRDLDDILTGYRAFRLDAVKRLNLEETGFGIETEMSVESLKHDQEMVSVSITYLSRPEDSSTNLHPVKDGARIGYTIYRMTKTNNPFFYFGSVGSILAGIGVITGIYVIYDWHFHEVTHQLLAILTALSILAGIQLFIFASLSDVVVTLHRDRMQEMRYLESKFEEEDE